MLFHVKNIDTNIRNMLSTLCIQIKNDNNKISYPRTEDGHNPSCIGTTLFYYMYTCI